MKPLHRAWLAASVAGAAGLALLALGQWGAGAGALSVGVAILLLVTEQGIPDELPEAGAAGSQEACALLAGHLHLEGNGIVQPGPGAEPSRLFLPAEDTPPHAAPPLDAGVVFHRDAHAPLGASLPPPGAGLESLWRSADGLPEGRGPEEAADHLRRAFAHLGLGRDVSLARAKNRVRVSYEPLAYADACRTSRTERAPWHLQGACPACSFAAILVARAHGAPVRLAAAGEEGDRVYLDLEVAERSKA